MGKLAILVGITLMVYALMERNNIVFATGMSLMLLAAIKELFPNKIFPVFGFFRHSFQVQRLEKQRISEKEAIDLAQEWMLLFTKKVQSYVASPFQLSSKGKIQYHSIKKIDPTVEESYQQFRELLTLKGVHISDPLLRIYLNHFIKEFLFKKFCDRMNDWKGRASVAEILRYYMDEEMALEEIKASLTFWNREMLLQYLERQYSVEELKATFPKWPRKNKRDLNRILAKLEVEVSRSRRLRQLEAWLYEGESIIITSISSLDDATEHIQAFSQGTEYIFQRMGYNQVFLNQDHGFHLVVERSGVRYGIIVKPKPEGEQVVEQTVQEAYIARVLTKIEGVMVVTNRYFEAKAIDLAEKLGVILIDRDYLQEWVSRYTNPFQQFKKHG